MTSNSSQANEPTNKEILDAINTYASGEEQRFNKLETELTAIKANMVTKEYLDDKLADLKGDIIVVIRKEDRKLAVLVDVLYERRVISDEDKKKILSLEPFPTSG